MNCDICNKKSELSLISAVCKYDESVITRKRYYNFSEMFLICEDCDWGNLIVLRLLDNISFISSYKLPPKFRKIVDRINTLR